MTRLTVLFLLMTAALAGLKPPCIAAAQQTQTGTICVSAFADTNGNGLQDTGESLLDGVNVNLATGGVIIATHITTLDDDPYCFEHLLPGIYTIRFTDSPTYRTTTANEGTFALEAGQRLTINAFGAFPIAPETLPAVVAAQKAAAEADDQPLETPTRLLLATVGAMLVMLFMVGVGAVILGVSGGRRRRNPKATQEIRPPADIRPPSR